MYLRTNAGRLRNMKKYIAVLAENKSKKGEYLVGVYNLNEKDCACETTRVVSEQDIVGMVASNRVLPLNFTVEGRNIVQSRGSFSRLDSRGTGIVIAELVTASGRVLGYKVISNKNAKVVNLQKGQIIEQDKNTDRPILQNAIIRNGTIYNYPGFEFDKIVVGQRRKKPTKDASQSQVQKQETKQSKYSPAQLDQLRQCKAALGKTKFIENPKLTPEQMNILWTCKKKYGAYSEYFNNPALSTEAMKFWGISIVTKELAEDCKPLFAKDYPADKRMELYLCAEAGLDCSKYEQYGAETISGLRSDEISKNWGDIDILSSDSDVPYDEQVFDALLNFNGYR